MRPAGPEERKRSVHGSVKRRSLLPDLVDGAHDEGDPPSPSEGRGLELYSQLIEKENGEHEEPHESLTRMLRFPPTEMLKASASPKDSSPILG